MSASDFGHFGTQSNVAESETMPTAHRISGVSSSHFLKMIEEKSSVGFWTCDFESDRLTISDGMRRLMGLALTSGFSHDHLVHMLHPDDRAESGNMLDLIKSGQPIDREFRIIRSDGTLRWVQYIADVLVDRKGVPIRAAGLCIDVTNRHDASRSVVEGWRNYKMLVSAIAPLQWRNLPDGQVIHRQGWDGIVGDCFDGSTKWLERVHPDDRKRAESTWTESLANGKILNSMLRLQGVDGEYRTFIARAAPILGDNGTVREWLGVLILAEELNTREPEADVTVNRLEAEKREMIEPALMRAARAALDWTKEELATKAGVSLSTVRRMEGVSDNSVRPRQIEAVRRAFEMAGVGFIKGPGPQSSLTIRNPLPTSM